MDVIATLSLRAVFQKILFASLEAADLATSLNETDLPFSNLVSGRGVSYTSAIAPRLAAQQSVDAVTLAHQLAEILPLHFKQLRQLPFHQQAIATHLSITANQQGWLIVSCSEAGIAAWLANLKTLTIPPLDQPHWPVRHDAELLGKWPLCDRLRVSLPLLCSWAYTRCRTLLNHIEPAAPASGVGQAEQNTKQSSTQQVMWTNASPQPCHDLLKTVMQALDAIAKNPDNHQVTRQQIYRIAEAIYVFDSSLSIYFVKTLSPHLRFPLYGTLLAAQKVMALIFMETFLRSLPEML